MSLKILHIMDSKQDKPYNLEGMEIRYDDTIEDIKKKLVLISGLEVAPEEIYLFAKVKKNISSEQIFGELTKSRGRYNVLHKKEINIFFFKISSFDTPPLLMLCGVVTFITPPTIRFIHYYS